MIALLSPAKTLDMDKGKYDDLLTDHPFAKETMRLVRILKKLKAQDLRDLMHISENLAIENVARYKSFKKEYTDENSIASIYAFRGDVYQGFDADTLNKHDIKYAQNHVRILSGLYGLLKPMDRMQAYRLEMGTSLENKKGKNLYAFWGDEITKQLNKELKEADSNIILNLASNEYYKAVNKKKLKAQVIDVDFREMREGKLKFISYNAKKARGYMARYMVKNRVTTIDDLKNFDTENYEFSHEGSSENKLLFVR